MNVEHLKLFIRVAATQNISMAGKELGLSAAVASAHINKLEQTLGIRLIHRTTRQVSLTEEGQDFLPHAEEVIASVEAARASVGAGSLVPQGTLRVSAPASFGRMYIMPLLSQFLTQHSKIKVDLRLSDTIVDLVEGGFDIAIRDASLNDSSLVARKLAKDERIICASPSYIERFGIPLSPQQLSLHNCITLAGMDNWRFNLGSSETSVKVQSNLRTDNGEALRDACLQGVGIAMNSRWSVYRHLQRGDLVEVLQDTPFISSSAIWAVYPSSRLLAPKVRAFIDFLATEFGDTPSWER
ncbi:LysR family transcriptional regulator [Shewanella waksmanii]|uniref:LysR family transcriptional regulator n=1 Tax=Shewanella waksmanii TaxID=213783 RepID=UPI00049085B5|nr:LysR family transcriptional regulator [Shewanella waksmanii]